MRTRRRMAIAALLAAGACTHEATIETPPAAVDTVAVEPLGQDGGVRYAATIGAKTEAALSFRASGYVERIAADEGDFVRRGTVLAEIRTAEARERLAQAAAGKAEAEANLVQATEDYRRATALYEAKSLTRPELDAAEARYQMAHARVASAAALVGEGTIAVADTRLVAPFDGVVLDRRIERGDLAAPGNVAFVLADTRTVKVELAVPDLMAGAFEPGRLLGVTTESRPGSVYPARVTRIAPAADSRSRAFPVELEIDNERGELKPGMVAALEIGAEQRAPVLTVPLAAVVRPPRSSDGYAVFVVEEGVARARRVELGDPVGNSVAVDSGLHPGERVVVSGPALLVDGQKVRALGRRQS